MRSVISVLTLAALLFTGYLPVLTAQQKTAKISEAEIIRFIGSQSEFKECSPDEIHIYHVEYFDFTGDGQPEAIVVAYTCMTGTAGPDVHAVYTRDVQGNIAQLPFEDSHRNLPIPAWEHGNAPLFGNPNYELKVEGGLLVARWTDASDRDAPVVAWFRWNGKKFVLDHMKVDGPFPTSYDCAKATKEINRAICYAPSVAPLDVALGKAYRNALEKLPPDQQRTLRAEQREWLEQREKQCSIYKWWVDCLADMYTKRIDELKQR